MTGQPSSPLTPPTAAWRWAALTAISVAMFGNYYVYDSIAPVADLLQKQLGFDDTQLGILNAIYSLPNIVMVLIGGVIVDRFGTRLSTLVFARSRRGVEILVRYLRDDLDADGVEDAHEIVRGYRGGYLPLRRREVEQGLRAGAVLGVVATSALELGIDIGHLDVAVLAVEPAVRGGVGAEQLRESLGALITGVKAVCGPHVLVWNCSSVVPGDRTSRYRIGDDPLAVRAHRLNLVLMELSILHGISIVDVDRAIAEPGAADHVRDAFRYSAEASEAGCEETLRIVEDIGFFEERPLVAQVGRRRV